MHPVCATEGVRQRSVAGRRAPHPLFQVEVATVGMSGSPRDRPTEIGDRAARPHMLSLMALCSTGLLVGSPAPKFSCAAHTGQTVSLDDFKGKSVLLWFYPRASTGG